MCCVGQYVRLPGEVFSALHYLPDPTPGLDGHYLPFNDLLGKETSESHRPSIRKNTKREKSLPFHGVLQHVKNVNLMLECEECQMWRLLYSKSKLIPSEKEQLQSEVSNWSFTCGTQL